MRKWLCGNVKNIIDVIGESRIVKTSVSNDISNIEGELKLKIYFESDEKIGVNVKVIELPFISKISTVNEIVSSPAKIEYDLDNGNIIIKSSVKIVEANSTNKTIRIVQDVTKKEITQKDEYSMIVYSVKKEDTLWGISKKFRVNQENIITSNQLEEPYTLKNGEKMYIIR